ncbi:MAG: hypothetical protein ACYTGC_00430 [Planctomycetota bacterium]|jgi:hypothetical protein
MPRSGVIVGGVLWLIGVAALGVASGQETPQSPPAESDQPASTQPPPAERASLASVDSLTLLLEEVRRLGDEITALRSDLAQARLEASTAQQELEELRQFIADHAELGRDFQAYRGVRTEAQRGAQQRHFQDQQAQREQDRADRMARFREARAAREAQRAEDERLDTYRQRGFAPLGLETFLSRMAFTYRTTDTTRARFDYEPGLGNYLRYYPSFGVDYSIMTISGSVLNASEVPRNIGLAIAFFDELGNQVGHEIVQVNNARPNVPYPFTSTIEMALDRPFASSTQYVLYADDVMPSQRP